MHGANMKIAETNLVAWGIQLLFLTLSLFGREGEALLN